LLDEGGLLAISETAFALRVSHQGTKPLSLYDAFLLQLIKCRILSALLELSIFASWWLCESYDRLSSLSVCWVEMDCLRLRKMHPH